MRNCDDGYPGCRHAESTGKWCESICTTKLVRMQIKGNIYRYSTKQWPSGAPKIIQAFERNPELRKINGRWFDCPNINIASIIRTGTCVVNWSKR